MKRATEVGGLISQHIDDLHQIVPNTWKRRTMYAVARCRTAAMGGHIDQCNNPECRKVHISYNSCRNRHCPKCQGHLREQVDTGQGSRPAQYQIFPCSLYPAPSSQ
jgi:hypothetical protein